MLTKLFFSHFFCTEKPFSNSLVFTNIFITSFSQYTTICFVSFVSYSVFNEHFFWSLNLILRDRSLFFRLKFLWLAFFSKKVTGGDDGIRTHDPLLAGQVLSQLSYTPIIRLLGFAFSIFNLQSKGLWESPGISACLSLAEGFRLPPFYSSSLQPFSLLPFYDRSRSRKARGRASQTFKFLQAFKTCGRPKWTRTTDLVLIRHAL